MAERKFLRKFIAGIIAGVVVLSLPVIALVQSFRIESSGEAEQGTSESAEEETPENAEEETPKSAEDGGSNTQSEVENKLPLMEPATPENVDEKPKPTISMNDINKYMDRLQNPKMNAK